MKILCAATWYKNFPKQVHGPKNIDTGVVIGGKSHAAIYTALNSLTGKRECEVGEKEEGFLTTDGDFINREDAFKIALSNDQILERGLDYNKLYSEFIKY